MIPGRRTRVAVLLVLSALTALPCVFDVGAPQVATATPTVAHGAVCWGGDLCLYSARRFMGTFTRSGWLVFGPIDASLDPNSEWRFALRDRGSGMVDLPWPRREVYRGDEEHGAVWSGIAIPLAPLACAFALYPFALAISAAVRRLARTFFPRRLPHSPRCPSCRYNLTGNASGICPECGTSIPEPAHA